MKHLTFFLLLFITTLSAVAQTFSPLPAPVTVNDTPLSSAWAGGLNAPQWSSADIDGDGKKDLYAFDRDGNVHLTFLNVSEPGEAKYEFAPAFKANFPEVVNYVLLRDYNQDGAADLFAHAGELGIPGLKVFNGSFVNNQLHFTPQEYSHWVFDVLTVPVNNGYTNLATSTPDYPAIDDIDNDGDLDIIAMDVSSGSYVVYYRNTSVELGLGLDTLTFVRDDWCWGKFFIPNPTDSLKLSGSQDTCAKLFAPPVISDDRSGGMHGAGALCTYDEDNDGDKELLYGDLNYAKVIKAHNNRTPQEAWVQEQDPFFPANNIPVALPNFPASFMLDIDNDGLTDYVAAPNDVGIAPDHDVWFYKNAGSNEFPTFNLTNRNFAVQDMIDLGTAAQPAFFDHNADGLMDFVAGNFSAVSTDNNPQGAFLYLFINAGTENAPAFELVNDNWLNFNQFSTISEAFAPAFGDLDGDGDLDLLVGEESGTIFFVENTAGAGNPATWGPIQPNWMTIDVGLYATPYIHDINRDGLPDLVVGERNGTINYMPNQGTAGSPSFHPDPNEAPNNKLFGGIVTQQPVTGSGFTAPVILEFGDLMYIATGTEGGYIEVYEVNQDSLGSGTFEVLSKQFGGLRLGTHSRISFANLNNDNQLDALVGNHRGGLGLFSSPFTLDLMVDAKEIRNDLAFGVFPNPATDILNIQLTADAVTTHSSYRIYNPLGQLTGYGEFATGRTTIDISSLIPGVYLIEVNAAGKRGIEKFMVR